MKINNNIYRSSNAIEQKINSWTEESDLVAQIIWQYDTVFSDCELEVKTECTGAAFIHEKSTASGYVETNREPKGSTIEVKALSKTAIKYSAVETLSGYTRESSRPTHVGDFWLHQKP